MLELLQEDGALVGDSQELGHARLLRRSNHRAVFTFLEDGHPVWSGQNEETNM